jgi:hypothetical protein
VQERALSDARIQSRRESTHDDNGGSILSSRDEAHSAGNNVSGLVLRGFPVDLRSLSASDDDKVGSDVDCVYTERKTRGRGSGSN